MKRTRSVLLGLFVVASLFPAFGLGVETPEWVRDAVCPMVGPMNRKSFPAGRSAAQILEDFRPEIAEWSVLPAENHPLRPKAIAGGLEYQEFPQGPKSDYALWEKTFGAAFRPTEDDGVDLPSSGEIQAHRYGSESKNEWWYMCHNAPRWHEFHRATLVAAGMRPNTALVRQDNIGCPSGPLWDNGGHCRWCLAGFKSQLARRFSAEQLKSLGVADLAAFDARQYLRAKIAQAKPEATLDDPLLVEYARFVHGSNVRAWADEVAAVHAARRGMPVCGNQGSGDLHPFGTVLLSAVGDLIFLENSRRAYPEAPNTMNYKLALAGGRHERPAWIWGFGTERQMGEVDGSRLFVAECYANQCTPYYEVNNLGHSSKKGYYVICMQPAAYEAMRDYARFAHAHRELLTRAYRNEADVALVYSASSFAAKQCGALASASGGRPAQSARDHFSGWARWLEAEHVPYNVEVFGDAELWPDGDLPARLGRYKLLILPEVEAISAEQAAAVERFVAGGGRLIASGKTGLRNERFEPLASPALERLFRGPGAERAIDAGDAPVRFAHALLSDQSRGASQQVVLNQREARPLVLSGWSKAEGVLGSQGADYSLYVDAVYTDSSHLYAQTAAFRTGTHDWQQAELTLSPHKPIRSLTVHCLFRYRVGRVWFDDLSLCEEGSQKNLLANAGFEQAAGDRAERWSHFGGARKAPGYAIDTQARHSGTRSIRAWIDAPPTANAGRLALADAYRRAAAGLSPLVETSAPATVFINPVRVGRRLVVHLVNYDYDGSADVVRPQRNLTVKIRLPEGPKPTAPVTLASPDSPGPDRPCPHRIENGRLEFELPELKVWSVLSTEY
jgi:hypothetical protein